jgi:hypothetical protein
VQKIIVKLAQVRSTKASVQMEEIETIPADQYPALGTTYVKQKALQALGNPKTLVLTIEAGDK